MKKRIKLENKNKKLLTKRENSQADAALESFVDLVGFVVAEMKGLAFHGSCGRVESWFLLIHGTNMEERSRGGKQRGLK